MIDVNIEILFPNVPCGVMSLDVQDILGTHKLDVGGKLMKVAVDSTGRMIHSSMFDALKSQD